MQAIYLYHEGQHPNDTAGIQELIDRCAEDGGGQVRVLAGAYTVGTIYLKSHVTLYLDAGAVLRGTRDLTAYSHRSPYVTMVPGVPQWYDAMLTAVDADDVTICGEGMIDGCDCEDPAGEQGFRGPHAIVLLNCRGVQIKGITVVRSGCYSLMFERCCDILVQQVRIDGGQDGIRLGACDHATIQGCDIRSGDDCIGGSGNRDVCILNSALNTPGGSTLMFSCVGLLVCDCVFWSPGVYPAVFNSDKRYSLNYSAICAGFDYGYPTEDASDDWVFRHVLFENSELLFRYEHDLHGRKGIPPRHVLFDGVRAVNLVFPSVIHAEEGSDLVLDIRNSYFSRAAGDARSSGIFLTADHCGQISVSNTTLVNYAQAPFQLQDLSRLTLENLRMEHSAEEAPLHAPRFITPGEVTVMKQRQEDESFRGPKPWIPTPICPAVWPDP